MPPFLIEIESLENYSSNDTKWIFLCAFVGQAKPHIEQKKLKVKVFSTTTRIIIAYDGGTLV